LEVRADNPVACGLYEHFGFVKVGCTHHLLRPTGHPWPESPAPQYPWNSCSPKDSKLWNALANAIYGTQQRRVLEIRPGLYSYGGLERWLNLWLSRQTERTWIFTPEQPQLALHVRIERRHHFHVWDMLVHPEVKAAAVQELAAKTLHTIRRFPPWSVVALVADQTPLIEMLHRIGFETHRTLLQMILDL
jgi:hypothetical protein